MAILAWVSYTRTVKESRIPWTWEYFNIYKKSDLRNPFNFLSQEIGARVKMDNLSYTLLDQSSKLSPSNGLISWEGFNLFAFSTRRVTATLNCNNDHFSQNVLSHLHYSLDAAGLWGSLVAHNKHKSRFSPGGESINGLSQMPVISETAFLLFCVAPLVACFKSYMFP